MTEPQEPDEAHPQAGRGIPFRVRIGVTGHRPKDLDDPAAVGARVRSALLRVCDDIFPPTDHTPVAFTLLSPIAEGADRIVATEARQLLGDQGYELEVVLPLTVADYETDFHTASSRREFHELLDSASSRIELTATAKKPGRARDAAYERAGRYVVDRSDVLIAVWDGKMPRGRGGTAEIVAYAQSEGVPMIVVPPRAGAQPAATLGVVEAAEALERLDEYNRAALPEQIRAEEVSREGRRLNDAIGASSIDWLFDRSAAWVLPHQVRADMLALRYQRRYELVASAIHFLAALAVMSVALQVVFAPDTPAWLGFEVGFVTALVVALAAGRWFRWHDRWISYRSLAEACRSGLFLAMTGVGDRGSRHRPGRDEPWFQRAFTEIWKIRPEAKAAGTDAGEFRRVLEAAWIDGQIAYHRGSAARFRERRLRISRLVYALAGITIAVAVLHILEVAAHGSLASKVFELLAIALPGFGAALTGIREQGQFRLHEERSMRTARRLARVKTAAEPPPGLNGARQLALEVQRVIDDESVDWSSVREFQDLEMVI